MLTADEYDARRARLTADAEDARKAQNNARAYYEGICDELRNLRLDWQEQQDANNQTSQEG